MKMQLEFILNPYLGRSAEKSAANTDFLSREGLSKQKER